MSSSSITSCSINPEQGFLAGTTYRIAFGPRGGRNVSTVQGAMPRDAVPTQALCADRQGLSLHARGRALRCPRAPAARAAMPDHHAPSTGQRARADQQRRAGGAQTQNHLA